MHQAGCPTAGLAFYRGCPLTFVPFSVRRVFLIRAETDLVSIVGRTQLFNPADLETVKKVQAGYKVQPLSAFAGTQAPAAAAEVQWIKPIAPAEERTSLEFFNELAFLLPFASPRIRARQNCAIASPRSESSRASPSIRLHCRRRCRQR